MQGCGLKRIGDWVVGRTLATKVTLASGGTMVTLATMDMTTLATRLLYASI